MVMCIPGRWRGGKALYIGASLHWSEFGIGGSVGGGAKKSFLYFYLTL